MLAADCDALQLYQDQLLDAPMPPLGLPRSALPPHGWNTWRAFKEWGILSMAAAHNLQVIVESPGLKEWSPDPAVYVGRILESARIARAIGGSIRAVALDEPFNAGFNMRQPAWSVSVVRAHLHDVREQVQAREPSIDVGLIEPYPTIEAEMLCQIVDAFSPAFFHLDIDYRHAASRSNGLDALSLDMSRVQRTCNSSGISHGIIVWGCDESSTDTWARSARDLLAAIQDTVHRGEMTWPHRMIVQSWSANGTAPRVMPPTLPADDPRSLWGLLRDVRAAL